MTKPKSIDLGAAQREYEDALALAGKCKRALAKAQSDSDAATKRFRAAEESLAAAVRSVTSKSSG